MPPTASSAILTLLSCFVFLGTFWAARASFPEAASPVLAALAVLVALAALNLLEQLVLKIESRPHIVRLKALKPLNWKERGRRATVGACCMGLVWSVYALWPDNQFPLSADFSSCRAVGLGLCVLTLIYIAIFEKQIDRATDHLLPLASGEFNRQKLPHLWAVLRTTALRGFFIPFMFVGVVYYAATSVSEIETKLVQPFSVLSALVVLYLVMMCFDLVVGLFGYLGFSPQLDTETRSTDSTWTGWLVCLICYEPFSTLLYFNQVIFSFMHNPEWYVWLKDWPALYMIWGALVVLTQAGENLSTLWFGPRFANLSYRGLISAGPYRLTKHPQYVFKLLNRFLVSVPLCSLAGPLGVLANMGGLCFLVVIYYLRARTEENHLSRYPEYVAYANAMNKRSVFRWMHFLRFDEERARNGCLLPLWNKN